MHRERKAERKRDGVTLLELTMVMLILAISAAVAIPRMGKSVEAAQLKMIQAKLKRDIANLQQHCVRSCISTSVAFSSGGSTITISPHCPEVLGDASGVVDYSDDGLGVNFSETNFDGGSTLLISYDGDLAGTNGVLLSQGQVSIRHGSGESVAITDLLTDHRETTTSEAAGTASAQKSAYAGLTYSRILSFFGF